MADVQWAEKLAATWQRALDEYRGTETPSYQMQKLCLAELRQAIENERKVVGAEMTNGRLNPNLFGGGGREHAD